MALQSIKKRLLGLALILIAGKKSWGTTKSGLPHQQDPAQLPPYLLNRG